MPLNQALISDESYNDGRYAYLHGQRSDANPHDRTKPEYRRWRDGWIDQALMDAAKTGSD